MLLHGPASGAVLRVARCGQSWKDKNIHTSVGAVALKKTGSRLFETTCREGENSRHVVFLCPLLLVVAGWAIGERHVLRVV